MRIIPVMPSEGNTRVYTRTTMAKVMISMPDQLLKRVDARAKERDMSRSALLREAVELELSSYDRDWVRSELEAIRRLQDPNDPFDSTDAIRHDRDTRDDRH